MQVIKMKRICGKDVALNTGYSLSTVMKVLGGNAEKYQIRPETVTRIREVARELGYQRSISASTMRRGVSPTIAVIGSVDSIRTQIVSGILKEASRNNFGMRIYDQKNLDETFDEIFRSQIQYIISMSVPDDLRRRTAELSRARGYKLVFIYENGVDEFPAVNVETYAAAKLVVGYLAGLGHRRIAYICAEHRRKFIGELHQGYLDGLRQEGLTPEPAWTACREDRADAIREMLELPLEKRPTAFFCIADDYAMLAQRCILKHGLRIPEDISVFGFGNFELAEFAYSSQSTVYNAYSEIGETACKVLLGKKCEIKIADHGVYRVPARLILRDSTAAPPVLELPCRQNKP